jgi:hypothetical protein
MENPHQQALAAMPVGDVEFILSLLPPEDGAAAPGGDIEEKSEAGPSSDDNPDGDDDTRRRRRVEREWPEIGTELFAEYFGVRYTADVFPANKKLKSGKQIRVTSGPALGTVCDSFSEAMLAATEEQRKTHFLGRKGVSNGWLFWQWQGKPENIGDGSSDDSDED